MEYDGSLDSLPNNGEGAPMGDFLRYWRAVFIMAFRHSLDLAQLILFVSFLFVGFAALFVPDDFAKKVPGIVEGLESWRVVAVVLFAVVAARLVLAPYWIWKEQKETIKRLSAGAAGGVPLADWVRSREAFTLAESACLLSGQQLSRGEVVGVASGILADLKRGIVERRITPLNLTSLQRELLSMQTRLGNSVAGIAGDVPDNTEISKGDLSSLAATYGTEIDGLG